MKREKQDIIFWQETHLSSGEHEKLRKLGFKNSYYSSFEKGNARGVAILISNKVNFRFSSQINDRGGCYLLVKGLIDTETSGVLVCGGDWNTQLNPSIDSSNKTKRIRSEAIHIKKVLKELGMIDVWRELHPLDRHFAFFSHPHSVYSRIDYFFYV